MITEKTIYLVLGLLLCFDIISAQESSMYLENEIYVKFKNDVNSLDYYSLMSTNNRLLNSYNTSVGEIETFHIFDYLPDQFNNLKTIYRLRISDSTHIDDFVSILNENSLVEFAERIPRTKLDFTPNDPFYSGIGQMYMADINAEQIWDRIKGDERIIVGVIDNGVESSHEDLNEVLLGGYNIRENSQNVEPDSFGHNHGTAMTGIIGTKANNEIGIASLASGVKILPVKGLPFGAYEGVFRAAYEGAQIINCSWSTESKSKTHRLIIESVYSNFDCIILTSAGNDNDSIDKYPSTLPGVFTIAGVNFLDDNKTSDSNFGEFIDFCAPTGLHTTTTTGNDYILHSGSTSAACALAAGMFALVWSINPNAPSNDVVQSMVNTSIGLDWIGSGHGKINTLAAIEYMDNLQEQKLLLNNQNIVIYPNPAAGYIKIQVPDNKIVKSVTIYNYEGKMVDEVTELDSYWLNIYDYKNGIYILKLNFESGDCQTTKFTKL